MGQELSPAAEKLHAHLVQAGMLRELAAWEKFGFYAKRNECNVSKQTAQTRRVLTWKRADGKERVKVRLVERAFQGPDLTEGPAGV